MPIPTTTLIPTIRTHHPLCRHSRVKYPTPLIEEEAEVTDTGPGGEGQRIAEKEGCFGHWVISSRLPHTAASRVKPLTLSHISVWRAGDDVALELCHPILHITTLWE